MGKRVAIVQSNYIPWKGYFDLIRRVDEFILFDDVQFTRRDWRNRNKIKTAHGVRWLTIPVQTKGKYFQRIRDTIVANSEWATEHWETLFHAYRRAPYFAEYATVFEDLYRACAEEFYLSRINHRFICTICEILSISTRLTWSMDYGVVEGKNERLIDLCIKAGATEYLSGPAAREYIDEELFQSAGITVKWMDYEGYPEYPQLYPPFDHYVSVVDLLFHTGPEAAQYLRRV